MIREADITDVQALMKLALRFHESSPYSDKVPVDEGMLRQTIGGLVQRDSGRVFVLERNDRIVGMLGVLAFPHWLSGEIVAEELFWWVDPDERGRGTALMERAEKWADTIGACHFQMVAPVDADKLERVYGRKGFTPLERSFIKRLN